MDKILDFIRSNALSLVIGAFFLRLFITTPLEVSCVIANLPKNYRPSSSNSRGAVNRFIINKLILNYQIWILSLQNLF
jgi:hypothetical protein